MSPAELQEIADKPEAGAFRYLRHRDPLWQAEIDIDREWEVLCQHSDPDSGTIMIFTVLAATATEAMTACEGKNEAYPFVAGARPVGSNGRFANFEDIEK